MERGGGEDETKRHSSIGASRETSVDRGRARGGFDTSTFQEQGSQDIMEEEDDERERDAPLTGVSWWIKPVRHARREGGSEV